MPSVRHSTVAGRRRTWRWRTRSTRASRRSKPACPRCPRPTCRGQFARRVWVQVPSRRPFDQKLARTMRRGCALRGEEPDKFGAGVDVELAVDACQVELDRLRAEEERRGNVAVRLSFSDLKCDLKLLRGQLLGRRGITPGDRLSARPELAACLLRPGSRAEPVEEFNRAAQVLACLDASLRA